MRSHPLSTAVVVACALTLFVSSSSVAAPASSAEPPASARSRPRVLTDGPLGAYKNLVVIYEENHSFDNLYGSWGRVGRDRVWSPWVISQVAQSGRTYRCLLQNDVNLTSPKPLSTRCADATTGQPFSSHFRNGTFVIDDYIPATATTCPRPGEFARDGVRNGKGLPGGCTRDLVHRFYQEQYQLHGGRQDRYVTGSDAAGLVMGAYDTKRLPIYRYLHSQSAPHYVVADNFFQAAYGGSFLNHQFLIAARAPLDTSGGALGAKHSVLDANGMPVNDYPLYKTGDTRVVDGQLTQECADGALADWVRACGDLAVNTVQPSSVPFGSGAKIPLIDDDVYPNIGDRMSDAGVTWNWYSGGWDDAVAGRPGPNFQFHHQPFNYFENFAAGGPGRSHLQDEKNFFAAARAGRLPQVSFVKPYGDENEHPGYASVATGSDHLVDLLQAILAGPQAEDTLVLVTYDEFGGQFDHVAPRKLDAWGDGTRVPALFVSAAMTRSGVDHTRYDTTSVMATIERQFGLAPVSAREPRVHDFAAAVAKGTREPRPRRAG